LGRDVLCAAGNYQYFKATSSALLGVVYFSALKGKQYDPYKSLKFINK
jgi:hypothetical protein